MLNLNQLRIFYHTAKRLSFTAAARDLFITQPAVSAQMKNFEDLCGLRLFRKRGKTLHLTEEGSILYELSKRIFECEREMENALEEMRELKRGVLRLGTTKTYARYFMPDIISRFHEAYPHIKVQLNEGSSLEMTESLLDFHNEVAIIAKATDHPDVVFSPFSQEEVVLITSPWHPFRGKGYVTVDELASEPIIMKEKGSGTRKLASELFADRGLVPNILMETGNTEFIKQLVQKGEGIAFLVKAAVSFELQEGKLGAVKIADRTLLLDVSIARLRNQPLSPAGRVFLDMLAEIASACGKSSKGLRAIMADVLATHWNLPSHGDTGRQAQQRQDH